MKMYSEIITLTVLVINTFALIFVIYQTYLSRKSLCVTKQSIDEAKKVRQLEILPKFTLVIHVQEDLRRWREDLLYKKEQLEKAILMNDAEILKKVSEESLRDPSEMRLPRFLYDNMPSWLREIWISGAQYYYNAVSSLSIFSIFCEKDGKVNFHYIKKWTQKRGKESIEVLSVLSDYLQDAAPSVIVNAPAKIDEREFLRD